jgi:hypothetical protein
MIERSSVHLDDTRGMRRTRLRRQTSVLNRLLMEALPKMKAATCDCAVYRAKQLLPLRKRF